MLRSLHFGVRSMALLSILLPGPIVAQRRTAPVVPTIVPAPSTQQRFKTPAEQVLIPYLKAHLKPSSTKKSSLSALDSANIVTVPNFAGYINAPNYNARTNASLATGAFNTGVTVEVGGDFDKDGKPDIAVFQQDGTLNILLSDGKGGLLPPVSYYNPNYLTSSLNNAYAVDVNGDGNTDIIGFDYNNNTMITWLNLGNGTFNAAITTAIDTTYGYPSMVYAADVNGDGKADLIYTNAGNVTRSSATIYLEVQLGAGDGTFGTTAAAKVQQFTIPASVLLPSTGGLAVADLNGDGKMDIAVVLDERSSATVGTYVVTTALGNGDGTFASLGTTIPIAAPGHSVALVDVVEYYSSGIYLTDVNGDGRLDVVSDIDGSLETALGNGDGTFAPVVTSDVSAVSQPGQSVVIDVNGDGKPDFVEAGSTMAVYLGKGDGTFALPSASQQYVIDPAASQSLLAADFTGDGILDVAQLGGDYKQIAIFAGNGTGSFRGAPLLTPQSDPVGTDTVLLTSGIYTNSGYVSPLFENGNGAGYELLTEVNDGKGNFNSIQALSSIPTNFEFIQPIHADFNGDGLEDLVYSDNAGGAYVALAKGDGSFATPVSAGLPVAACPLYYGAAGDLNGDGKADLVMVYAGDAACGSSGGGATGYYVSLGNGDGTFAAPVFTATGTELYSLALADLNGDGKLDLLINDVPFLYGTGFQLSEALGNGDGTFGTSNVIVQNYLLSNVVTADINGDGNTDLILSSEEVADNDISTGGILITTGNGDGTFNTPSQIATGNFFYGLQVADMNNDGNSDIVATLYSTPAQPKTYYGMVTLLGFGNGQFSAPVNQVENLNSMLPQVGNFTGDAALDVMTETSYGPALFIGQGGATLGLTDSDSSIVFGQVETLTATLTAGLTGRPAATGTISFYDGTTLLGTGTLSTTGTATLTTTSLTSGMHTVKAVYAGDTNFNPAASSSSTITVAALAPAFTLAGTSATMTVSGSSQGVITLNLAANASFSGAVNLSCSGMPSNGTCAINPGSVTLTQGGPSTATLVVGTAAASADLHRSTNPWKTPATSASLATLLCIFFSRRKRARMLGVLGFMLLLSIGTTLIGCSNGGSSSAPASQAGTYTVTVTATPFVGSSANPQSISVRVTIN